MQPLSLIHHRAIAVVLSASPPPNPLTPLAHILDPPHVGIELHSIAHVHVANPEALVLPLPFLVVQHAPAEGFRVQRIALPAIAFAAQVHDLVALQLAQIHALDAQQRLLLHIHHHHSLPVFNSRGVIHSRDAFEKPRPRGAVLVSEREDAVARVLVVGDVDEEGRVLPFELCEERRLAFLLNSLHSLLHERVLISTHLSNTHHQQLRHRRALLHVPHQTPANKVHELV